MSGITHCKLCRLESKHDIGHNYLGEGGMVFLVALSAPLLALVDSTTPWFGVNLNPNASSYQPSLSNYVTS